MKKFITVLIIATIVLSLLNCCETEQKKQLVTTDMTARTTVIDTVEEPITESKTVTEKEDELQEDIISSYNCYKFEFEIEDCKKTDYKKNFSQEVLNEIYDLIPMYYGLSFGCDDYDNWNGNPNAVLNDIYTSMGYWMIESYDYGSEEVENAIEELNANPYGNENREGFFTSVDKINSLIRDIYGPDARLFKAEDFDTYDEIKTSEESVFTDYDYSFRFAYLPNSKVVCAFARETWGGETQPLCLCDVRMSDGDYVAEVVLETNYDFRVRYIMTMSGESNGNIYLNSIDEFYVLPDGVENNMKVVSEDVQVMSQKYASGDLVVVGTLYLGDEVYSPKVPDSDEEYIWIVSDRYRGMVEKKNLCMTE